MRHLRVLLGLALVRLAGRLAGFTDSDVPLTPPEPAEPRGWWTLSGDAFIAALYAAHHGEHPELVYAELYANADHEDYRT